MIGMFNGRCGREEPLISEFLTTALEKLLVVAPANFEF
jgi:hypothetical protein